MSDTPNASNPSSVPTEAAVTPKPKLTLTSKGLAAGGASGTASPVGSGATPAPADSANWAPSPGLTAATTSAPAPAPAAKPTLKLQPTLAVKQAAAAKVAVAASPVVKQDDTSPILAVVAGLAAVAAVTFAVLLYLKTK